MSRQTNNDFVELPSEISAISASHQAANEIIQSYEDQVKSLKETITKLEVENVGYKQLLDTQKSEFQHLQIQLLTTINERDLTIEELKHSVNVLSLDVQRIEKLQAEYKEVQQKYNKLYVEHESLVCTSNATEEERRRLLADNTRMQLDIDSLNELVEVARNNLMGTLGNDEDTEVFTYQECFQGLQQVYECLSKLLWESVKENSSLRDEIRAMRDAVQGGQDSNDLLVQFAKLSEAFTQLEIKIPSGHTFRATELSLEAANQGEENGGGTSPQKFLFATKCQEQNEAAGEKRLVMFLTQLGETENDEETVVPTTEAEPAMPQNEALQSSQPELQFNIELQDGKQDVESSVQESENLLPVNSDPTVLSLEEVTSLKATVAELQAKLSQLQSETARQSELLLQNTTASADELVLPTDNQSVFSEISCLINSQRQKLTHNVLHIGQLQEKNAQLTESLKQAEAKLEQTMPSSEHKKQIEELRELLTVKKDELKAMEQQKIEDDRKFASRLRRSETDARAKFWNIQELKTQSDREVARLKGELLHLERKLRTTTDRCQGEQEVLQDKLNKAADSQKQMILAHSLELERFGASLRDQIEKAEGERNEALEELSQLRSAHEEFVRHKEEALGNEHQQVVATLAQIQELQQKYDQLTLNADLEHKQLVASQIRIQELQQKHSNLQDENSSVKAQLHDLKLQTDLTSSQHLKDKRDLEDKLEAMSVKNGFLKQELENSKLEAASELEDLKMTLSKANEVSAALQDQLDFQQSQLASYKIDMSIRNRLMCTLRADLKDAKDTATSERLDLGSKLEFVEQQMAAQAGNFEKQLADLRAVKDELQNKLKSEQDQNNELKDKQKMCSELEAAKTQLEDQLRQQEAAFDAKLSKMKQEIKNGLRSIEKLTEECFKLRCEMQDKAKSYREEKGGLEASLSSLSLEKIKLEEKLSTLNLNADRNAELEAQLRAKSLEKIKLEEKLSAMNLNVDRNAELIVQLRAKETESEVLRKAAKLAEADKIKFQQYKSQTGELEKELEHLRATLKSKETNFLTEREGMNSTISCLLENKRNLEEKLCKLEEELAALKAVKINQSSSSSSSAQPLASPNAVKPLSPHNPDSKGSAGAVKKSSIIDSVGRKERRKTAHDEHRKQSLFNDFRDFGTMTDPAGKREAVAWNMELFQNPLKDPLKAKNRKLKMRIIKEQQKAAIEQKRLRRKIRDLTIGSDNQTKPKTSTAIGFTKVISPDLFKY